MQIKDYMKWVSDYLLKAAKLSLYLKVIVLYEEANGLLNKVNMDLSVQEEKIVIQLLATRATPSPKILIKDHKTINEKGKFPTKLVTPATNFTATLSKLGYLGIEKMLVKSNVNYSRVSIVQSSYLKERPKELELNRYGVTITSVDDINMYPSFKITTTKKAVRFFARQFTAGTNNRFSSPTWLHLTFF